MGVLCRHRRRTDCGNVSQLQLNMEKELTTKVRRKRPVFTDAEGNVIKDPRIPTDVRFGVCKQCARYGLLLTADDSCKPEDGYQPWIPASDRRPERRAEHCRRVAKKRARRAA